MKKAKLWRLLTSVLAAALLACVFAFAAACGGEKGPSAVVPNDPEDQTGGTDGDEYHVFNGGDLRIRVWDGGFGHQWLTNLKAGFEARNPGVKVSISGSVERQQVFQEINANTGSYDLYFSESLLHDYVDRLVPLDDVFDFKWANEQVRIEDKIDANYFESVLLDDGHRYMVPAYTGVYGFMYNKDYVDLDYEELPVTTDELKEYVAEIKATMGGVSPFMLGNNSDYWQYAYYPWFAQYEGRDVYINMLHGKNADGELDPSVAALEGGKLALQVCEDLLWYENGYVNARSNGLDYMAAQQEFLNGGSAFIYTGSWTMNEMKRFIPQGADFGMMQIPVISALGTKLGITDEQLAGAVRAIDAGETSYSGLTDEQFARIKEARSLAYVAGEAATAVIPKFVTEDQQLLAKTFLRYMWSEEGILKHAQAQFGGILPVNTSYSSDTMLEAIGTLPEELDSFLTESYTVMFRTQKFFNQFYHSLSGINKSTKETGTLEQQFISSNPADRLRAALSFEQKVTRWSESNNDKFKTEARAAGYDVSGLS